MSTQEKIRRILLIQKIKENEGYSASIGIEDVSTFLGEPVNVTGKDSHSKEDMR